MPQMTVYQYRVYDIKSDEYVYSSRYATMTQIKRIGAEPVHKTGIVIDTKYLTDGWTKKGFDPKNPS